MKLLSTRLLVFAILAGGCGWWAPKPSGDIEPEYDADTGRLELLKYDSNSNGIVDTWSYMDAARVVRIEIDRDEDGKIDRWEYYDADQKLERVGLSREHDGIEDAWSFVNADGSLDRIEVSSRGDGHVDRVEHYRREGDADVLSRAEEDANGDGTPDKWETYDEGRLASVAFDTANRGMPDRRLVYHADGSASLEVDRDGTGTFTPVTP